ncbi:esterase-like activity of phytase family protein [Pedobacter punctiformis]|uniref:Esterase-like activity of phytase family protein n=1 Tax=Pedobacter punctiformis TaxID=3004097 RepID=A0ABT4LBT9_9SPHI|nr:esterase-like activity of phytase family protein [Pedobacter sp. HCMS5-2]MCZ4245367.1 esterase-like activity of phytase family protein [Pedobacter sp. HCMS5-2]
MKRNLLFGLLSALAIISSCKKKDSDETIAKPFTYPAMAEASDPKILLEASNGVKVYNGGFGSAVVADPSSPDVFYMLTDRGPNADGTIKDVKVFGIPDFTPQIGKFRLKDGKLILEQTIELKTAAGIKLNGLPNPTGSGSTGETAVDLTGKTLTPSIDGLDPEGMVRLSDGSFWLSDEYGPHLLHVDATGRTLERVNPFGNGTGGRSIPAVFAKRKANRGMEGLAITPDGKTLVGIMQSPMLNPTKSAADGSVVLRILTFEIATGATKQYVYLMDNASLTGVSEIVAVNATTFLTIERDGDYGGAPTTPATFKKIFKINLSGATDVSDASNAATGKLYNGKTVEELKDLSGLTTAGIVPVSKSLVLDLLKDLPAVYPHDKAEGLALINGNTLVISNDDDFGVVPGANGSFAQKMLPLNNTIDRNRLYFVNIKL